MGCRCDRVGINQETTGCPDGKWTGSGCVDDSKPDLDPAVSAACDRVEAHVRHAAAATENGEPIVVKDAMGLVTDMEVVMRRARTVQHHE